MQEPDLQTRFDDFFRTADAYLADPNVMTGLELDEKAGRVRQHCFSKLKDDSLGQNVEAILGHIRNQESQQIREITDRIAEQLGKHDITVNRKS